MNVTPLSALVTELEALTGASNHIQFATETIARSALAAATQAELHQQIESIQQRLTDSSL